MVRKRWQPITGSENHGIRLASVFSSVGCVLLGFTFLHAKTNTCKLKGA